MQTEVLIWLLAGVGLGVFLTMSLFALIVAIDLRIFSRGQRRLEVAAGPADPPRRAVATEAPRALQAASAPWPGAGAPAENIAAAAPVEQRRALPEVSRAAPAARVESPPAPNVEELFAKAFEAVVPTTPKAKSELE